MNGAKVKSSSGTNKKSILKRIKRDRYYYLMIFFPVVIFILFKYLPMAGNIIAFRRYQLGGSMFGTDWSGLRYFKLFFKDRGFWNAFKNTLLLSFLNLLVGFPIPIIFALLVNELRSSKAKKIVQTVSYLPKFLSTAVVVGLIKEMFSPSTGIINSFLVNTFHIEPIFFVNEAKWFRPLYVGSDLWQFMGWNAIIYLAALSGVDVELYDAASIDGAGRFKQTLYVTIPGIMPTIVVTLILAVGRMLTIGFEKALLLYTPMNSVASDILDTFVYRIGIQNSNYSYATAIGLFSGVVGLILVSMTNAFAKKTTGSGIY